EPGPGCRSSHYGLGFTADRRTRNDRRALVGRVDLRTDRAIERGVCRHSTPALCLRPGIVAHGDGNPMSESISDSNLRPIESALRALLPATPVIARDRVLYEAGRRSASRRGWPILTGLFAA